MDLKNMTYINKDGLRVTDTRIIQKEFGISKHSNLMRTTIAIIKREKAIIKRDLTSETSFANSIDTLFIESTYQSESGNGTVKTLNKYEVTEEGFYFLAMHIKGGTRTGVERLHVVRRKFINSFFHIRSEYNKVLKAYKILAEKFLPIDERGHISLTNGAERLYAVHGYYTTRKTRNEITQDVQDAFNTLFQSEHKNVLINEVVAHESSKPKHGTPSKAYLEYMANGDISQQSIQDMAYYEAWDLRTK